MRLRQLLKQCLYRPHRQQQPRQPFPVPKDRMERTMTTPESSTINCTLRFRGSNARRRIPSTDRKAMLAPSTAT